MTVHLDIRTKVIMLVFVNALLLANITPVYEWMIILLLCLWSYLEGEGRRALVYLVLFSLLFFSEEFFISLGSMSSYVSMFAVGGRLLLPCFMIGGNILRSSVHEFIAGMRKWHIPESLLLAVAVMMRFLPTIKEDYKNIRNSLKIRGIFRSNWSIVKHPLAFFEQVTIPLLMSATRTAQDLTLASLTKAAGGKRKKTSYDNYGMTIADGFVCGLMLVLMVCLILN